MKTARDIDSRMTEVIDAFYAGTKDYSEMSTDMNALWEEARNAGVVEKLRGIALTKLNSF